ncbi:MAG: YcxB family protein [Candidatus Amoebophilus sp.]
MIVRTKKYKLPIRTYMLLGLKNIIREQWWVFLIAMGILSLTFLIKSIWLVVISSLGLILYFLFWLIQFYGVTQLAENKIVFERLGYELTSQQIIIQIDTKRGMPVAWEQIKRASQGKDYFLLVINKAHLIHLPYKIFNSKNEIKFVETILKRKGLIR